MFGGSDRRLKTDIQKIGTHSTGLPIYAYRYKGDPKSYPKVAGPMAEDVMKIAPHAVRPMTTKGHMAVHMPTLDALGAGATPPSSPGVGRAIGALGKRQGPLQPGVATPPSRGIVGRECQSWGRWVADNPYAPSPLGGAPYARVLRPTRPLNAATPLASACDWLCAAAAYLRRQRASTSRR